MGRRNRKPQPDRSAPGASPANLSPPADLSENALCDDSRNARVGAAKHRARAGILAKRAREGREAGGSAAALSAHHVRSGNDPPDRLLPWHRKLFAALFRKAARRSASNSARLPTPRPFDFY